ncbi:MAG: YfhO family protein, partial [Clostridiales bacterium]|nr:YfhO family protein [Clostridiales bacterium]
MTKRTLYLVSFFIPFTAMFIMFAVHMVYPFGDRQILVTDFWQQYFPFLSDYWRKLREGHSFIWSWSSGVGGNYLAQIAYYMASPLNFLTALFPLAWLREVLTVILLIKFGCAGLFMALYLHYTHKQINPMLPLFAAFYALCAFSLGYYWNIMWVDTFALLPLVMLGLQALLREGKFRVYIAALALSVVINYYIGLFTCVFTAIMFHVLCVANGVTVKEYFRKLATVILASAAGIGLTAFLTVPTYMSLLNSYSAVNKFPANITFYHNFVDILGNFIAFTPPTDVEGLPNVYSGMLCLMLLGPFMVSGAIRLREKITYLLVIVFLLFSFNINALYYIWNGFHFTNMIPYRFSFLMTFLVVSMAYRVWLEEPTRRGVIAMAVTALAFLTLAFLGEQENIYVYACAGLCLVYLVVFGIPIFKPAFDLSRPKFLRIAVFAVTGLEILASSFIGVTTVRTSTHSGYPAQYDEVRQALAAREDTGADFYRTEFARWYSVNDPPLYGYDGVAMFSSTVNVSTTRFMLGLGLPGGEAANRYYYAETSPLTNALLNIRYLVDRSGNLADGEFYWEAKEGAGSTRLLENKRYLPLGFMVNPALADYESTDKNPFLTQNDLFRKATGLEGDLFEMTDIIHVGHKNYKVTRSNLGEYSYSVIDENESESNQFKWNYLMPGDGLLFSYCAIDGVKDVRVHKDDATLRTIEIEKPYMFTVGRFAEGEQVSIMADSA